VNRLDRLAAEIDAALADQPFVEVSGTVREVTPTHYRVSGLSSLAKLGDRVTLRVRDRNTIGEIVRVDETRATVKPFDTRFPVGMGMSARLLGAMHLCPAPGWKGRVINSLGEPIDGLGPLVHGDRPMPVDVAPPPAMTRQRVQKPLRTGVRVIDLFTPFCEGQRIGIFAGSGVGKSTLLSMLARSSGFDTVVVALVVGGACFLAAYFVHARHTAIPALDLTLFCLPTFFASVVGGFMFRLGLGALPFLLPLMLQVGFGMSPFHSGLVTFASAAGAMGMKWATGPILRRFGFRNILVVNALISSAFLGVCAGFTVTTPVAVVMGLLLLGGFFRSLQFTSINTIAYAELDNARVSRATSLVSVAQQISIAAGVALGALAVEVTLNLRGGAALEAADFPPAFLVVTAISAASALIFARLPADAGAELANRLPAPAEPTDKPPG